MDLTEPFTLLVDDIWYSCSCTCLPNLRIAFSYMPQFCDACFKEVGFAITGRCVLVGDERKARFELLRDYLLSQHEQYGRPCSCRDASDVDAHYSNY